MKKKSAFVQPPDQSRHLVDRHELVEALVARQFLVALEGGGYDIGDVHPIATDLQESHAVMIKNRDLAKRMAVQLLGRLRLTLQHIERDQFDLREALLCQEHLDRAHIGDTVVDG